MVGITLLTFDELLDRLEEIQAALGAPMEASTAYQIPF
jgi:hypothetical protein